MSDDTTLLLFAIAFVFFGTFLFWLSLSSLKDKWKVQDIPTAKIRSAAQGYVEIVGKALDIEGTLLTSPLTKQPCFYYFSTIVKGNGDNRSTELLEIEKTQFIPIDDGTGVCFIPINNVAIIGKSMEWYGDSLDTKPEDAKGRVRCVGYDRLPHGINGYIVSNPIVNRKGSLWHKYKFEEITISPGDKIYALGEFKTLHETSMPEAFKKYFIEIKEQELLGDWYSKMESLLTIYDEDKNGYISGKEREKIKEAARNMADKEIASEKAYKIHILDKPTNKNAGPHIVSRSSQKKIISFFNIETIMPLIAGSIFFMMSFALILARSLK